MNSPPRITTRSWLMIATLAFVWGGTFLVTEVALTGMGPYWIAASRVIIAAMVMGLVWGIRGFALFEARPHPRQLYSLTVIGAISSAVPFTLLAWGQQYVTSGFAGVSMASTALIILPLAYFFVPGEGIGWRRVLGFLVGFAGVVVLIGTQAFDSSGSELETAGRLACVSAAGCYAVSSILMRRLPAIDAIGLASILLIIGAVVSLPLALAMEGVPAVPTPQILGILLFLGLVPTAAAAFLRVLVVRTAGPVFMSLVNYQVPVWSVVLGALILSEPLPPELLYALALILAGLGISQYSALKRLFGLGSSAPSGKAPAQPRT